MQLRLDETANVAVLGGNLPPSFGTANDRTNRGVLVLNCKGSR